MHSLDEDTEVVRRMTPEAKLAVLEGLIRQAWELKVAIIRARDPDLAEAEIRAQAWKLVGGD